ncbi:MAG: hypothetical protein OQK94_11635 [Gammaproteobacteria bacterium]|nr:hypothetical protein [Gammaproteobacteria bacterium]MCW8840818.1 hypothetical protein [Gammaproteobacteria bacterium]MCW8928526.1 hypothetical protein [Gammaproteobacteria bacterium]MCW8973921.1 hypothetical protein [Gammaproteobacteria bacterium]MCW8992779.1 hypothetical protein [Gammaproteobacteria bacterium]
MESEHGILFVYKADSGLFNTVTDIAHKVFSPETYECNLCALTHGYFTMRQEWEAFINELGLPSEFLHRDEVAQVAGVDRENLPAVYRWREGGWQLCLGAEQIDSCTELEQLKSLIKANCK